MIGEVHSHDYSTTRERAARTIGCSEDEEEPLSFADFLLVVIGLAAISMSVIGVVVVAVGSIG